MESPRKIDELPEVFELIRLRDACRRFITAYIYASIVGTG